MRSGGMGLLATAVVAGMVASGVWAEPLAAQGGNDIWVASIRATGSTIEVGRGANVTRRAGYDNQPAFTRDGGAVLFTSIREDAQADIWRVSLTDLSTSRVTTTPESEYSATPMPDGAHFSVIRVEADSTQRLWRFPFGAGAPSLVLTALRPVGYHAWLGDATLATFVLGTAARDGRAATANALVLVDARTERADTLARNIGRALQKVPGRDAFTFVQMGAARTDTSWISEVDTRTHAITRVAPALARDDYHVWTAGGRLISASGSRLMLWMKDANRWDVLHDFSDAGVKGITRLALSPAGDRIAFVTEDVGTP